MAIDFIYLSLLIIALVVGFIRGFIASLFALIAMVVSILAAVNLSRLVSEYLQSWLNWQSPYMPLIAFIIICFGVLLIFRLLAKLLERVFSFLQLTLLNKMAGAVLWSLAFTILYSTLLWYGSKVHIPGEKTKADSKTYETLLAFAPLTNKVIGYIIPPVKNIFNELSDWFESLDAEKQEGDDSKIVI